MIGYCATARNGIASAPPRQMKSAMTAAKTGRSMKKLAMASARGGQVRVTVGGFGLRRGGAVAPGDRSDDVAGDELLEPVDDDPIAGLHAILQDEVAVDHRPGADRLDRGAVLGLEHVDEAT